jgi:hypothetical protein
VARFAVGFYHRVNTELSAMVIRFASHGTDHVEGKKAIFSISIISNFAVLQYTRTINLRQRGTAATERTDDGDVDVGDVLWSRLGSTEYGLEPVSTPFRGVS